MNAAEYAGIVRRSRLAATTAGRGRDAVARADLNTWLGVCCSLGTHTLLDLTCHGQERLLDIGCVLGRSLKERNAEAVSKLLLYVRNAKRKINNQCRFKATYLRHGVLNHFLIRHIALVTDKQFVDALGGIAIDLLEPLLDVVERIHVRYIVDNADTMSTTVVR